MPARSEAQRKFFQAVYDYQQGKLPEDKASKSIKRVAASISPHVAKKYTKLAEQDLTEILTKIVTSPKYTEQLIRESANSVDPIKIKGRFVDFYTGKMLVLTLDNLTEQNKNKLLQRDMDEIVAVSYKLITH